MTTICGAVNFSMPLHASSLSQAQVKVKLPSILNRPWTNHHPCSARLAGQYSRLSYVVRAAPEIMSEKVEKSVEEAKEVCSDDPESGECVAAWDEVEELSAAASHAREREKESSDPLEEYCKENPETDECRIYDN